MTHEPDSSSSNPTDWQDFFIDREAESKWLQDCWYQTKEGKPQLCVLTGESGLGKTKVAQEFYRWLSRRDTEDPDDYWPDFLVRERQNLLLNPVFELDDESPPRIPYLWWGLRWIDPEMRNQGEMTHCAFYDGRNHLYPHWEHLQRAKDVVKKTAGVVIPIAAEIALSFAGPLGLIKTAFDAVKPIKELVTEVSENQLTAAELQEKVLDKQVDDLLDFFGWVLKSHGGSSVPVVLLLDDAQWMDSRSITLVKRLLGEAIDEQWPLMIVATHWEREWHQHQENTANEGHSDLYLAAEFLGMKNAHPENCHVQNLGKINGQQQILASAFPGLSSEQLDLLADQADGNGRLLDEMILWLQEKPHYFVDQDLEKSLLPAALDKLRDRTFKIHDLQEERFNLLQEDLRKILALGSAQGGRFLADFTHELAEQLRVTGREEAATLLDRAVSPYAMISRDGREREFRFKVFHDLASAYFTELSRFGAIHSGELCEAAIETARRWISNGTLENLASSERENLLLYLLNHCSQEVKSHRLIFLSELLLHYQREGYILRCEPWLEEWKERISNDTVVPAEEVSIWSQIEIVRIFIELCDFNEAEKRAEALAWACEELGESRYLAVLSIYLGDINKKKDALSKALSHYQKALTSFDSFAKEFGETREALRDVSVSQDRVGDVLSAQDDLSGALTLYQQSLSTRERIVEQFGETREALRDVMVSNFKIGMVYSQDQNTEEAIRLLSYARVIALRKIESFGNFQENRNDYQVIVGQLISFCESAGRNEEANTYRAELAEFQEKYG